MKEQTFKMFDISSNGEKIMSYNCILLEISFLDVLLLAF